MLYVAYIIVFSLISYAIDMSAEKKAYITDRVTAKKAKAYIYGTKEIRKLAAVTKMNIFLEECMKPDTKSCKSTLTKYSISVTSALTVVFWLTLFVLYLYTVRRYGHFLSIKIPKI